MNCVWKGMAGGDEGPESGRGVKVSLWFVLCCGLCTFRESLQEGAGIVAQPISDHLAFASRNCPQEILLLVWRIVSQVKAGLQGLPRRPSCKSTYDLQPPSTRREKSSTGRPWPPEHRQSCHVLYDGNHEFALNGWERYTELGKAPQQHTMPPPSRPPSSSGTDKNYIILTPLNPGGQVWKTGV